MMINLTKNKIRVYTQAGFYYPDSWVMPVYARTVNSMMRKPAEASGSLWEDTTEIPMCVQRKKVLQIKKGHNRNSIMPCNVWTGLINEGENQREYSFSL